MKACIRCLSLLPLTRFSAAKGNKDRRANTCKACAVLIAMQRRAKYQSRTDEEIEAARSGRGPKECFMCKATLSPEMFGYDRGRPDGMNGRCIECNSANSRADRAARPAVYEARRKAEYGKNRANYRRHQLSRVFGITLEQYESMLEKQGGLCAICRETETLVRRGRAVILSVDHDHDTGQVRALLCSSCNRGLGFFRDNPRLLTEAADYILVHALIADLLPEGARNG